MDAATTFCKMLSVEGGPLCPPLLGFRIGTKRVEVNALHLRPIA